MKNKFVLSAALSLFLSALTLCSCSPVDKDYAVSSESSVSSALSVKSAPEGIVHPAIMSDDKIMPQFVDISVFDEENYSEVYLGKKFKFNVSFAGAELTVPTSVSVLEKNGWRLLENSQYDKDSLVYACD